jgi:hypothetical protein
MTIKIALYAPETYWKLAPHQKKKICNGCGTKGLVGAVVPDSLWGMDITEACNIHDYMYATGETIDEKYEADRVFLNNMLRMIDGAKSWWPVRFMRSRAAVKYYYAVRDLGGPAFWSGKNPIENLGALVAS